MGCSADSPLVGHTFFAYVAYFTVLSLFAVFARKSLCIHPSSFRLAFVPGILQSALSLPFTARAGTPMVGFAGSGTHGTAGARMTISSIAPSRL